MNRVRVALFVSTLLAVAAVPDEVSAEVALSPLFTDGAVLQRGRPVPVWGRTDPGAKITVSFAGQRRKGKADAEGRFTITLRPMRASKTGRPLEVRAGRSGRRVIEDVLVGEVWLCSGQSNMAWPLARTRDGETVAKAARHPGIRLLTVGGRVSAVPREVFSGRWTPCVPRAAERFSAVAFYFGRELHEALGVPIGLISSNVGGTPAEAWTSLESLRTVPAIEDLLAGWEKRIATYDPDAAKADYEESLDLWEQAVETAKKRKKRPPRRPRPPIDPRTHRDRPAGLYNGKIAPLVPYAMRGVIWYQGESNAGRAVQYRTLFPALIRDWRRAWQDETLPFHFVQLANFKARGARPGNSGWAELRDAQLHTLRTVPGTGMAVIIDIGEARDIHPRNKEDVGRRLALWALARDYGKKLEYSGPLYRGAEHRGAEVVVSFDHVGKGLVADGELAGFSIAGAGREFIWAKARIEGETVVVWHPDVPKPAAVRYAWADNPVCSLRNEAGLPASPFRTDDWPLTTK